MERDVTFKVEQAGCSSCAERVREALAPLASVHEIALDEPADLAIVRCSLVADVSEEQLNEALAEASTGAGHAYRVAPASLRAAS